MKEGRDGEKKVERTNEMKTADRTTTSEEIPFSSVLLGRAGEV